MRFRTALCLATLFVVCFTAAAWSTPALTGLCQAIGNSRPITSH
jgi:hypothetical protein